MTLAEKISSLLKEENVPVQCVSFQHDTSGKLDCIIVDCNPDQDPDQLDLPLSGTKFNGNN